MQSADTAFFPARRRAFKRRRVLEQRRKAVMSKHPSVWKASESAARFFANAIKQTAIVYLFGRAGLRIGWTSAEVCRDVPCRQSRDAHSIGAAVMKHR
jgi:hypothetical protein